MATEVGVGYVRLLPSMQGFSSAVGKELGPSMKAAGASAGGYLGGGIVDGVDGKKGKLKAAAGRVSTTFTNVLKSGGLLAGTALVGGMLKAFDQEEATAKLEAQLGGGEVGARAGELTGELWLNGFGDTVGGLSDQVGELLRSGLIDPMSAAAGQELELLLTYTSVMDQDPRETMAGIQNMINSGLSDNQAGALDFLTAINQQSGTDEAAGTFKEFAAPLAAFGLSDVQAGGLALQMQDSGVWDFNRAIDSIYEFTDLAQDETKTVLGAYELLGIDSDKAIGMIRSGQGAPVLGEILDKLREVDDETREIAGRAFFGERWIESGGLPLLNADLDTAAERLGSVDGRTADLGSAFETNAQKLENFKRKGMQKFTDFLGGTLIPAFEDAGPKLAEAFAPLGPVVADLFPVLITAVGELAPAVGKVLEFVTPLVEKFADLLGWFNNLPEGWQTFIIGVGALAALAGPIGSVVGFLSSMWGAVVVFAPKVAALVAPILGWPLIIGAALIAIGILIYKNWDTIKAWLGAAWEWIKSTSSAVWGAVRDGVADAFTSIVGSVRSAWESVKGATSAAWEAVKGATSAAWEAIKSVVGAAVGVLVSAWDRGVSAIKNAASAAWEAIKSAVRGAADWIVGAWGGMKARVQNAWSALMSAVRGAIRGAYNYVRDIIARLIGRFRNGLARIRSAWSGAMSWAKQKVAGAYNYVRGVIARLIGRFRSGFARIRSGWSSAMSWAKQKVAGAYNYVRGIVSRLISRFQSAKSRIIRAFSSIGAGIKSAFRSAFRGVIRYWNRYVGGKGFSVPSWIPGIGGKSFRIPKFHTGGVYASPSGSSEGLALLEDGEGVFTREQMAALGGAIHTNPSGGGVRVVVDANGADQAIVEFLRRAIRVEGGDVQSVLGAA